MEFRSSVRSVARLLNTTTTSSTARSASLLPLITARGHKTTARTKRSLKIAPHDSFLPDRTAAFPTADSIIYNPPSSAASPYHTPFLFLPENDPRRAALERMRAENPNVDPSVVSGAKSNGDGSPALRYPGRNPKSHLTKQHIAEMRELRSEDPLQWSVSALAKKYECSPVFVQIATRDSAGKAHMDFLRNLQEKKRARWGPKKTQAMEEREMRRQMELRGEL